MGFGLIRIGKSPARENALWKLVNRLMQDKVVSTQFIGFTENTYLSIIIKRTGNSIH